VWWDCDAERSRTEWSRSTTGSEAACNTTWTTNQRPEASCNASPGTSLRALGRGGRQAAACWQPWRWTISGTADDGTPPAVGVADGGAAVAVVVVAAY